MIYEGPTPIFEIPLGWEAVAVLGTDLREAKRIHADQRQRAEASLIAIDAAGNLSVWICCQHTWPLLPQIPPE